MSTDYDIRFAIDPVSASAMNTEELREHFLIEELFTLGGVNWTYTHYDRMAVGGAMPAGKALDLDGIEPTGTVNFLDRREMIVVNIGGAGTITVDGTEHALAPRDMLYIGMGSVDVVFASAMSSEPAKFYLLSAPAHASYPTKLIRQSDAKRLDLGSQESANERSIFQFVNPDSVQTCQLVVGLTSFAPGSVWNTMPAHVHDRRMEAYLYFDLKPDAFVVHLMGEPDETRHLIVRNEQAILSPPWSIHSGAGTGAYTFIWAMAGDNVDYTDVEKSADGSAAVIDLSAFSLDGKTVLVTGANTGIGQGIALSLGRAGAKVIGVGRSSMADTETQLAAIGASFVGVQCDLSSSRDAQAMFQALWATHGPIDGLVNNAGIIKRADAVDLTEDDWDSVMDVNLKTMFFLCQSLGRAALSAGRSARIVNIASMLSFQGGIRVASYTASKSGVLGITRLLANEWAAKGINVNAIAPGYIETNNTEALRADPDRSAAILGRIPAARWGAPSDIGDAAVFLLSIAANYMHGAVIPVDGGWLAR